MYSYVYMLPATLVVQVDQSVGCVCLCVRAITFERNDLEPYDTNKKRINGIIYREKYEPKERPQNALIFRFAKRIVYSISRDICDE